MQRWFSSKERRGCLPTTIRRYAWVVRRAQRRLRAAHRPTDPRRWSLPDARWLRERLHEDRWQLSILADLAKFSGNAVFQEAGLPRPPPVRRIRWLTRNEAEAIIAVTKGDLRLRLVALLGIAQGLRRIEWLRLRVGDIDLAENRVLVRGKGRGGPKLVWMPLHPALPEALRSYLSFREQQVAAATRHSPEGSMAEELLVHPVRGALRPYSLSGADRWVAQIARLLGESGVVCRLSSHMFRRSGATFLERALLDAPQSSRDGVYRVVQGFLRHENLATTMQYLEADPSRQARALGQFAEALPWGTSTPERPRAAPSLRAKRDPPMMTPGTEGRVSTRNGARRPTRSESSLRALPSER
ncbi:MAG TPA: site-specific integrase [Thermoplasmata archaeon]|nr:site-specific integrase [Thermoplasmata archaeon]